MRYFLLIFLMFLLPSPVFAAKGDIYLEPTVQNLSQLYWALGHLNVTDDQAIDQYLMINDCDDFSKVGHGTTEWREIEKTTRAMLSQRAKQFSTHIEVILPLALGRFDQEHEKFLIEPGSQLNKIRKIDVAPNSKISICGSTEDTSIYPRNIILALEQPFTLRSIPVLPGMAAVLLKAWQQDRPGVNDLVYRDTRLVYLRMKISVTKYLETIEYRGHWRGVVSGNVDGYEVYGDYGRQNLIYKSSTTKQ